VSILRVRFPRAFSFSTIAFVCSTLRSYRGVGFSFGILWRPASGGMPTAPPRGSLAERAAAGRATRIVFVFSVSRESVSAPSCGGGWGWGHIVLLVFYVPADSLLSA